ncbi:MAG: 30S ribosomal protein S9 [Planctomycetes bacterium]|nr:30S ribosomal protein S9 [Planctomycetota bacterium]
MNDSTILETQPDIKIPDLGDRVLAATGRRKSAKARVRMRKGTGTITVNERPFEEYFLREQDRHAITAPLRVSKTVGTFDLQIAIKGGGYSGQAGAALLGVARCLIQLTEELIPRLRERGYLTRDARATERKKYGRAGARRSFQYSKR